MASRKKKRRSSRSPVAVILLMLLAIIAYTFFAAVEFYNIDIGFEVDLKGANIFEILSQKEGEDIDDPLPVPADGEAYYHFIDVGQGDAILITTAEGNMLVDTSEKGARDELDAYLKAAGITSIRYLVLTHPDADHIGNADYVIQNYNVQTVLMTDHVATSKTYERLLDAIEEFDVELIIPELGEVFTLGAVQNTVIAPVKDYDDPNEMSLVIKSVYGETSVMLTGDAEVESEGDIVEKWSESALKCDILKVGHHGSTTSTTEEFLSLVAPKIAVISCGEDNKYGHPHDETMEKLTQKGITIYRTDTDGSIIFKTDGKAFSLVELRK